jgi:hypothetical protein
MAAPPTTEYTFGAALTWTQGEYGYLIQEVETFPTLGLVTAPAANVVGNNGDRLALVIVNVSVNDIYVSIAPSVNIGFGIKLLASGGSLTMNVRQDLTLPSRAWFGISAGLTTATIYVLELIGWRKLPPGFMPGS